MDLFVNNNLRVTIKWKAQAPRSLTHSPAEWQQRQAAASARVCEERGLESVEREKESSTRGGKRETRKRFKEHAQRKEGKAKATRNTTSEGD